MLPRPSCLQRFSSVLWPYPRALRLIFRTVAFLVEGNIFSHYGEKAMNWIKEMLYAPLRLFVIGRFTSDGQCRVSGLWPRYWIPSLGFRLMSFVLHSGVGEIVCAVCNPMWSSPSKRARSSLEVGFKVNEANSIVSGLDSVREKCSNTFRKSPCGRQFD